jgi:hypothetical protein
MQGTILGAINTYPPIKPGGHVKGLISVFVTTGGNQTELEHCFSANANSKDLRRVIRSACSLKGKFCHVSLGVE